MLYEVITPIDMNVFDLKEKKDKIIFSQEF